MRKTLEESNILIVGLARDCEGVISSEVQNINAAFSSAKSVQWLIIESDSSDCTTGVLNTMAEKLSLRYLSLGRLRDRLKKRTQRLSECRNKYIEEIRSNDDYAVMDFVVVADLDGANCNLTSESVTSCWQMEEDWDACFANQSEAYYDIYALRHKTWSPNDCWSAYKFLVQHGINHFDALNASIYSRMIKINESQKPIKVRSAFGGMGIYKKCLFEESNYFGLTADGCEVCEHVSFHEALHEKGRALYINPKLINCGWNEHNRKLTNAAKAKARLRYYTLKFVTKIISKEKLKNLFKSEA
ncbi:MAG: hypothetical protein CMF96_08175 [Candidatus Marinimicrobia bacterium]|nr:hypothetical protein [Candidatus Neomarinimicrobiota bacterium]|tara:strand:+ start:682 stop:1584 length:903 start_codon:yes stop_codon:yes gene_type:complete